MGSPANARIVERFYHDLWNRFDEGLIAELLAPDIRFRGSLGDVRNGHEEFAGYLRLVRAAFPDFTNRIEDLVSEGDRSFARLRYTGTHRGEIFGIAPTGARIEYEGAARFRFHAGRIAEAWVLGDLHGLLRQLRGGAGEPAGAAPPTKAAGGTPGRAEVTVSGPAAGYRITFEPEATEADRRAVTDGLRAFNVSRIGDYGRTPIDLIVRDAVGAVAGGLLSLVIWEWLYVDTLWLSEALRGKGIGGGLLAEAEARARALGCRGAFLDTFDFQALPFYRKHGYRVFGTHEGFPAGHRHYYLEKELA